LRAELERLRGRERAAKEQGRARPELEGQREGRAVAVWGGSVSGDAVQRAVAEDPWMAREIEEFIKKNERLLKTKE